jgi:hypothetical protein
MDHTLAITLVFFHVGVIDMYISRRYDRRYSVLVYHLAHVILEQYDELVERFYLALKLDSVYQEYRNWHMLPS